jgi:hypothetical protein
VGSGKWEVERSEIPYRRLGRKKKACSGVLPSRLFYLFQLKEWKTDELDYKRYSDFRLPTSGLDLKHA